MKHTLKQMQYRFTVIYETPRIYIKSDLADKLNYESQLQAKTDNG